MTVRYDTGQGVLRTAGTISSTVLPNVLKGLEFWLFMFLHLAFFLCYRWAIIDLAQVKTKDVWGLDWHFAEVVTSMTIFFEVFYSNQCYARYTAMYRLTRAMLSDTQTFACAVRAILGARSPQHSRAAVRCTIAGVLLHFYNLKGQGNDDDMGKLPQMGLLKPWEVACLQRLAPIHRPLLMYNWAAFFIHSGDAACSGSATTHLLQVLMKIRYSEQMVVDMLALQIPFPYYHLLSMMVTINLCIWAYSMALTQSLFAPFIFASCMFIFLGMVDLAGQLSDPFGDDDVDFDLGTWGVDTLARLCEMSEAQPPPAATALLPVACRRSLSQNEVVVDEDDE